LFQDPRTSPFYEGLRSELARATEEGVGALRRRAQAAGMARSTPAMRAESQLRSTMAEKGTSLLGRLYEQERALHSPLSRLGAAFGYGGLPREVEKERAASEYTKQLQDVEAPYRLQAPLAAKAATIRPYYQPMYVREPSGFEKAMNVAGTVLTLLAHTFPGRFGLKAETPDTGGNVGFSAGIPGLLGISYG